VRPPRTARGGTALLALVSVLIAACSPERGPQTGSQTNWLTACRSDTECGDLECLCGTCTASCDAEADCADLTGASCVPAEDAGAIALCGGCAPAHAGFCLQRCDEQECDDGTACVAGVCTPLREPTVSVSIDSSAQYQSLVGFGAGIAYMDEEIVQHSASDALYDAMFSESGFDVLRVRNRYNDAGSGNLSAATEIVGAATERMGRAPVVFMSSWSPPGALKADGAAVCSGNLDTCTLAQLEDGSFDYPGFATHWRESLDAYAAEGLEPDYVGIQNDPDWVPPASAPLEACRFLPVEGTETVNVNGADVEVRYPGFSEALAAVVEALTGLASVPLIAAPETTGVVSTVDYASQLDFGSIDAIGNHMYGTDPSAPNRDALLALNDLGQEHALPVLQTEMRAEGLETAILMQEALSVIGVSAYLQNDFVASSHLTTPDPTALISLTETDFTVEDPYYAMAHFARDTDPGWIRVAADSDAPSLLATAWLSPGEDALTVVLVNTNPTDTTVEIAFGDDTPTVSRVTRTVFPGVERMAELGELAPQGIMTVPGHTIVTVATEL
jgi:glucuronoarabinoxylan endo-1,4-beta-xylanase